MEYIDNPISLLDTKRYAQESCTFGTIPRITVEGIIADRRQIPSLNRFATLEGLKDGSLVRFKCMVQDTLDRVMKHQKLGDYDLKFRSGFEDIPLSDTLSFSQDYYNVDRYTVVSVPGDFPGTSYDASDISRYFETGAGVKREMGVVFKESSAPKRSRESFDMSDEPPAMVPVEEHERHDETEKPISAVYPHPVATAFMPRSSGLRISAIANVCDAAAEFKLHDVVEITGIVSNFTPCEADHATIPLVDLNIQVIHIEQLDLLPSCPDLSEEQISIARSAAKSVLKRLLLGDDTAAEYLLLQLVSARVPGNDALPSMGSWGLNLANTDKVNMSLLSKFVAQIVSYPCVEVPASNDVLLNEKFYPHRPIEQDFTSPGFLQLAAGSTVLIDERQLGEGNVNALNVLAINKAVRDQELIGVFGSSEFINFKTDLRFIILNAGNHTSIFGNTNPSCGINGSVPFVTVPIVPWSTSATLTDADIALSPQDLQLLKDYVSYAQSLIAKVDITETVVEKFQRDWVESRKQEDAIPTEDIHSWATLLRVMPASQGQRETTLDTLELVLDLERSRRIRLKPHMSSIDGVDVVSPVTITGS